MEITQEIIDDPTEEQQLYFDRNFAYLYLEVDFGYSNHPEEVLDGRLLSVPDWCDEGSISCGLVGDQDYDPEKCLVQYIGGYHWDTKNGDIKVIEKQQYKFISTVSLSEEMCHQNEDGASFYENRGPSFLAVWEKVNDEN